MTPKEVVDRLRCEGVIPEYLGVRLKSLIEECVTTGKAEAKDDEARRCAKVAEEITMGETGMHYGFHTARKILRTRGLKVEE